MDRAQLTALYRRVKEKLGPLDFSAIWPGFSRFPFALYTGELVCMPAGIGQSEELIPWDGRFRGNTAIEYEGGYLAIWDVERDFTGDGTDNAALLAADLVHEMFHAYQYQSGETRFPRDVETLDYPMRADNFTAKLAENRLIAAACKASCAEEAAQALARACALRKARAALIGEAMLLAETLSETAEGMAEYAGMAALRALDPAAAQARESDDMQKLEEPGPLLYDVRRMAYFSGVALLLAATRAGIDFMHDISREKSPVFDLVARRLPAVEELMPPEDARIKRGAQEALDVRRREIAAFLAKRPKKTEGPFCIVGYDPMNMRKADGLIYCAHFVALKAENADAPRFLTGESVLESDPADPWGVLGYYFMGEE